MSEPVEGEVVEPGKVYICERGKAESTRAQMDRRGEFGGVVRESEVCPEGQIFAIDMDAINANLDAALAEVKFAIDPPTSNLLAFRAGMLFAPNLVRPHHRDLGGW